MRASKCFVGIVVPALFFVFTLAAWAGGKQEQASTTSSGGVQNIFYLCGASNRAQIFETVIKAFNAEQNKVHVGFQAIATNNYLAIVKSRIAAGNPPDIADHIVGARLNPYIAAHQIVDLTNEAFMKKIYPSVVQSTKYEGRNWFVPLDTQAWGIFYNKDLFKKAGIASVPKTYDQFVNVVQKLKQAGITPFETDEAETYVVGQLITIGGSPVYTPAAKKNNSFSKGHFSFGMPGSSYIFKDLDLVIHNSQKLASDANTSTQYAGFAVGKAAMMPQGNWSTLQIRELNKNENVGFFPMPISNNAAALRFPADYALVFDVLNKQHMDGVRAFVSWFLDYSDPAVKQYYNSIGIPTAVASAEGAKLDPMMQTLASMLHSGKTVGWLQTLFPGSLLNTEWQDTQQYALSVAKGQAASQSALIAKLDKDYSAAVSGSN